LFYIPVLVIFLDTKSSICREKYPTIAIIIDVAIDPIFIVDSLGNFKSLNTRNIDNTDLSVTKKSNTPCICSLYCSGSINHSLNFSSIELKSST